MEDITTENQPTSQKFRIKKSNPKYMQADFVCVALTVLCVRDRGTEFV